MFKYTRPQYEVLCARLENEPRRFIQVLYGPRQVGKTTLITQFAQNTKLLVHQVSADAVPASDYSWISQQWEAARFKLKQSNVDELILILDEIQKVENWSEQVKKEWDNDSQNQLPLKVILLGSSRLLLQQGLTESLAGRFEAIYMGHWPYSEIQKAFGITAEEYVWFGGYPGSIPLIGDESRWKLYITQSLIEASISRDIFMMTQVNKPALMRRLFELGCAYSGQILSYSKILGQLQDAGNTTTLAHYLDLLGSAGLLTGLEKYSPNILRQRASSPKFQVSNTALISAQQGLTFEQVRARPELWGRWVESSIGAHLLHYSLIEGLELYYWRDRMDEVDFVLSNRSQVIGIEVKSKVAKKKRGMKAFQRVFDPQKVILISDTSLPWQEFLSINPKDLF
ncbi:MAG: ATP-binding protein [Bacteroidota bacterium]